MKIILQHPIYKLFDDPTTINTLLFLSKLIEKYYFVFFTKIPRHTCFICIHKLITSSNCYD